jgi:N-acetylmuramoyl-L-alanine amidase
MRKLFLFFAVFFAPRMLRAEPLAALAKEAFSVRNADSRVQDINRWKLEKKNLYDWVQRNRGSSETARALFLAATIDRGLAVRTDDLDYAISALKALQKIEREYSKSAEIGYALIEKAELFALLGAFDEAKLNYKKVVDGRFDDDLIVRAERGYEDPHDVDLNEDAYIKRVILSSKKNKGEKTVVLDPGHGGEDLGAVGYNGIREKSYVLDVARRVKENLSAKGITVVLTRNEDRFVPLGTRTRLANEIKADLFVSLHANATAAHDLAGLETYYLDNSSDEGSRLLAERENGVSSAKNGGGDLSFILSDLVQTGKLADSVPIAHAVERSILKALTPKWPKAKSLGVKKAPFYVLVGAHMPCILVEMFFIDNPADAEMTLNKQFRTALADGISEGISK